MILIADCGSTKSDWLAVRGYRDHQLESTQGFNPFFQNSDDIARIVTTQLTDKVAPAEVSEIWFYGAGIHDESRAEIVRAGLEAAFPGAAIHVLHDLLGAARATCGRQPGIACILGTGSNSCYYDGKQVLDNVPSLGWILGDEGSGTHLGKALLRARCYREMPEDLVAAFDAAYPDGLNAIKDRAYEPGGNVYLAQFTRFMGERLEHPFIYHLVAECLGEFLDRHVAKYNGYRQTPIHFVGSIAHHFRSALETCMAERKMKLGQIIRKPIYSMADYHVPNPGAHE